MRIAPDLEFTTITSGAVHTCGLDVSGAAWCWGFASQGALGTGASDVLVTAPSPVLGGLTFRSLDAAGTRTCGVTTDDVVYCWGAPYTGDGGARASTVPVRVGRL